MLRVLFAESGETEDGDSDWIEVTASSGVISARELDITSRLTTAKHTRDDASERFTADNLDVMKTERRKSYPACDASSSVS